MLIHRCRWEDASKRAAADAAAAREEAAAAESSRAAAVKRTVIAEEAVVIARKRADASEVELESIFNRVAAAREELEGLQRAATVRRCSYFLLMCQNVP